MAVVVAVYPAAPAAKASSGGFDPGNPTAGIVDPIAGMAPLDRNCASGQIDVNTASSATLISKLGLSKSAAAGVLSERPWQRSIDIISVPGVPTSVFSLLGSKFCAEPTVVPVATPLACDPAGHAVDLQSASVRTIVAATGMTTDTASRLVAARPLPQDLHQVKAPRVPGFSDPNLSLWVKNGVVCVTPAPFTYKTIGWRWAGPGGTVVTAPAHTAYALYVPAGATSGDGTWGTVTVLSPDQESPRADYHLVDGFTGEVGVRIPSEHPAGTPGSTLITHFHGTSPETFSYGSSVVEGNGVATTSVSNLSTFQSDPLECLPTAGLPTALFDCSATADDVSLATMAAQRGAAGARAIAPTLMPGPCTDGGDIHSSGTVPYGMSCGHDGGLNHQTEWDLWNNTGADVAMFSSTGAVYHVDPASASGYTLGYLTSKEKFPAGGLVALLKEHAATSSLHLVMADSGLSITKTAGSPPSTFHLSSDHTSGAALWTVANMLSVVDDVWAVANQTWDGNGLPNEAKGLFNDAQNCVVNIEVSGLDGLTACVESLAWDGVEAVYDKMPDHRTKNARVMKSAMRISKFAFKYGGLIANAGSSATFGVLGSIGSGDLTLWMTLIVQPPPAGVGAGNGGENPGGGADGTILVDNGDAGNVLFHLANYDPIQLRLPGNTMAYWANHYPSRYDCFAHLYPLRDWLPYSKLLDYSLSESELTPTCDPATEKLVTGTETNYILRQANGHAWFVDGDSHLHSIPDGGTYICLAQRYYVLDNRTDGEIAAFGSAVPFSLATCP